MSGFTWAKKAKIMLETKYFHQYFQIFPIFTNNKQKLDHEILSLFPILQKLLQGRTKLFYGGERWGWGAE